MPVQGPHVVEHPGQRVVGRSTPYLDYANQVDAEKIFPQRPVGIVAHRHQLHHAQGRPRDTIAGISVHRVAALVHDVEECAAASTFDLWIGKHPVPLHLGAFNGPRSSLDGTSEGLREYSRGLSGIYEPHGTGGLSPSRNRLVPTLDPPPLVERSDPIAESSVDGALRGPQRRDRLAALVQVAHLAALQPGQDAPAGVRRLDSHRDHTGRG